MHDGVRGTAWGFNISSQLTDLALDLFACPAGGITCASAEVLVRASLPGHRSQEVMAEVFPNFAVLESIGQVTLHVRYDAISIGYANLPNDTACRSKESLSPVRVLLNSAEQVKDRVKEGNKKVGLVACLHGVNSAIPSIKNAFPQRRDVIDHLIVVFGGQGNLTGLLQHLSNDGQVCLESAVNGMCNVAKALQDSRLELVSKSGALSKNVSTSCT